MDDQWRADQQGISTDGTITVLCECESGEGSEVIEVEQVLGAEMSQKVIECDLMLPDCKPNIGQIVDVYVKDVKINSIDVICDRVLVRGDLEVKVMYVAKLPNEPVHAFEKSHIKFIRDIDVEGALAEMKATADCSVEYIDYDFNDCDPRKVHVTIVLKIWTRVTTITEMEITPVAPVNTNSVNYSPTAVGNVTDMAAASEFVGSNVAASQNAAGECQMQGTMPPFVQNVVPIEPEAGTTQTVGGMKGTVTASRVNLRTGPGTNYPSIMKLNKGDELTIKEQAFGWYKVVMADGDTTGWVASWFVNL